MSKTKRIIKIISGVMIIISGWLAIGIGFTIKSSFKGIIFYSGFILIITGILILAIKKKNRTIKKHGKFGR